MLPGLERNRIFVDCFASATAVAVAVAAMVSIIITTICAVRSVTVPNLAAATTTTRAAAGIAYLLMYTNV